MVQMLALLAWLTRRVRMLLLRPMLLGWWLQAMLHLPPPPMSPRPQPQMMGIPRVTPTPRATWSTRLLVRVRIAATVAW